MNDYQHGSLAAAPFRRDIYKIHVAVKDRNLRQQSY
jgi:hypothetical protein